MKAYKVISDPEAFQILADETRRRIIYLLRAKERTVSQIAEELRLTPQAIYHHIRKLKDAGMVEVAREERVDHFIETYYQASAELFHLSHGQGGGSKGAEEKTRAALENLPRLGFPVKLDPASVSRIVELAGLLEGKEHKLNWAEKVSELKDLDFFAQGALLEYANLLSMSDKEFDEHMKRYKELRKTLRSGVAEPPKVAA